MDDENEKSYSRDDPAPAVRWSASRPRPERRHLRRLLRRVRNTDRGLLWCGPRNPFSRDAEAMARLSRSTGFPLLADPLSGLRHGPWVPQTPLIGGYDGFLHPDHPADPPPPDVLIRFGAAPTASNTLQQYFNRIDATQILVRPDPGWEDPGFRVEWFLEAEPSRVAETLSGQLDAPPVDEDFQRRWLQCEREYWTHQEATSSRGAVFEGSVVRDVVESAPDGALLFVSNSLPVRDLQRYTPPTERRLTPLGNRGVSGIDGVLSSAFGAGSAAEKKPLLVITGDIAFYHDMNGLLALKQRGLEAVVVVINNDGGGIFHTLPIEDHDPPFTPYVKMPHGLEFQAAARQYNCRYRKAGSTRELSRSLDEAFRGEGSVVIEVPTDAEASQRRREQLLRNPTD